MTACGSIGALMVGGRVVGQLKCELDAGHDGDQWLDPWNASRPLSPAEYAWHNRNHPGEALERLEPTPHRVVLEWADTEPVDLDLFDPAEHFDVDVPIPEAPPRLECVQWPACIRGRNHDGPHNTGSPEQRRVIGLGGTSFEPEAPVPFTSVYRAAAKERWTEEQLSAPLNFPPTYLDRADLYGEE